jgi:hypothetical protein
LGGKEMTFKIDTITKILDCGCENRQVIDSFTYDIIDKYRLPCYRHTKMICTKEDCSTCKDKKMTESNDYKNGYNACTERALALLSAARKETYESHMSIYAVLLGLHEKLLIESKL